MRLARLYSASSRLARRSPPPEHEFFFFFLFYHATTFRMNAKIPSPRGGRPSPPCSPPRDIFIARFHSTQSRPVIYPLAFSLARVSQLRCGSRGSSTGSRVLLLLFTPPTSPSFCFLNRYPLSRKNPLESAFLWKFSKQREQVSLFKGETILSSYNFDLNVRNT